MCTETGDGLLPYGPHGSARLTCTEFQLITSIACHVQQVKIFIYMLNVAFIELLSNLLYIVHYINTHARAHTLVHLYIQVHSTELE